MGESIFFPSVNWYPKALATGSDGSVVYGSPAKGLTILQAVFPTEDSPLNDITFNVRLQLHAHLDRVIAVNLHPLWPTKMNLVSAGLDKQVKHWQIEINDDKLNFKALSAHNVYNVENEEIVAVGYLNDGTVMAVGVRGCIVKWDLKANVTKRNKNLLKQFKPTCLSCSPHSNNMVAVGTKQGVIVIFDAASYKKLYKVRGHTDEVYSLSWCPKLAVTVKRQVTSTLAQRLANIQSGKVNPKIGTHVINDGELEIHRTVELPKNEVDTDSNTSTSKSEHLDNTDINETEVQQEDLFDMYTEPALEEFGHKKYQPETIIVKESLDDSKDSDFLEECMKLKERINEIKSSDVDELSDALEEASLVDRVNAISEKLHLGENEDSISKKLQEGDCTDDCNVSHTKYKNVLASCDKFGKINIWDGAGVMIACTSVFSAKQKATLSSCVVNWMTSDCLLLSDGNSNLLAGNPLDVDCKNRFQYEVLHSAHRKGLYLISTSAPNVIDDESEERDYHIWSVGQNRNMSLYSYRQKKLLGVYPTFGGNVYQILPCPNDALKYAIASGDGTVKVWELEKDEKDRLINGRTTTYWQNVQGKVLNVAWHPTKENLVAFGTAEGRVGLIDTSGKGEKPARILRMVLGQGVYSICWGDKMHLYACGGDKLAIYNTSKADSDPEQLEISCDGTRLYVAECSWCWRGLALGDKNGVVAVFSPNQPHQFLAVTYGFKKLIQSISWHPHSQSTFNSPYKNWIAVASTVNEIAILDFKPDLEKPVLDVVYTLEGHIAPVNKVVWSPDNEKLLLSVSSDTTIRLWECTPSHGESLGSAIVGGGAALCASFCSENDNMILAGGSDCHLRLFTIDAIKGKYAKIDLKVEKKKHKKNAKNAIPLAISETEMIKKSQIEKKEDSNIGEDSIQNEESDLPTAVIEQNPEKYKKLFTLPLTVSAQNKNSVRGCYRMLVERGIFQQDDIILEEGGHINTDYIKLFGTPEDVAQFLDMEQEYLLERKFEAWCCAGVLRGDLQNVLSTAAQQDSLSPFLLSLAPGVSHKFWKDAIGLYAQQCERMAANNVQENATMRYGGSLLRRALCLLCVSGDSGCAALAAAGALREAIVAASLRRLPSQQYIESLAEFSMRCGHWSTAAECYIALEDYSRAAKALDRAVKRDHLKVASRLASYANMHAFAESIDVKIQSLEEPETIDAENLPTLDKITDKILALNIKMDENLPSTEKDDNEHPIETDKTLHLINQDENLDSSKNGENLHHTEKDDNSHSTTKDENLHLTEKDEISHSTTNNENSQFTTKDENLHPTQKDEILHSTTNNENSDSTTKDENLRPTEKDEKI